MPICKCNPKEHFKHFLYMKWEHCPLEDDGHTSFMVFLCQNCNGIDFLPTENMKIAMKKGTEKTKKILKTIIE